MKIELKAMMEGRDFAIMIVGSIVVTWALTMTLLLRRNRTANRNKAYQSLLMGSWMGLIMGVIGLLSGQPPSPLLKAILALSGVSIIVLSYAVRQQSLINANQFMLGMIEHHQMAIDMVRQAEPQLQDPRLEKIANDIVSSQTAEIEQMQELLRSNGIENQNNIFNLFS